MERGIAVTASSVLSRHSGVLVAAGVMSIVFLMVVPVPRFALDLLLAFNISLSVLIFLLGMYTERPLDFSVFPSALLIVTLFRLALNVSSTRLILTRGSDGPEAVSRIIAAFGDFVVGGNFVVGIVIFLILVVINFVVITKGTTRIAEVSARFTLDSLPGKQMAIDADLHAGAIGEEEAGRRRRELSSEADFYGAMDGASKFVRGDAVAALVITGINLLGGLVVGVLQKGMPLPAAAATYTTLTVGDGLVHQMPALVISTSAGILVSRAGSQSGLGRVLPRQLLQAPGALGVGAGVLLLLGLVPGLPFLPFGILAGVMGGAAYAVHRSQRTEAEAREIEAAARRRAAQETPRAPEGLEEVTQLLHVDALELEVGYGLLHLVDPGQGGDLLERVRSLRRQVALDLGIVVPPVRIRDNLQLRPAQYVILIKGVEAGRGELKEGHRLVVDAGALGSGIGGIPTRDPASGGEALWVPEGRAEEARLLGGTVMGPSAVVAAHLAHVVRRNAHELLGRQETQNLLDAVGTQAPALVEVLVPDLLPLGAVQRVLQNLLREGVAVRDLRSILEALADWAPRTKDPEDLTEHARAALRRGISRQYQDAEGRVPVIALDHRLEEALTGALQRSDQGSFLSLEPKLAQRLLRALGQAAEEVGVLRVPPVVLTPPAIRLPLRRLTERAMPGLVLLSHDEVEGPLRTLKVVSLEG
ncbi:MAG: flagellar biosynthesis protein FlhA [Deferrisomatales bacterium]|nr:flagellar biosynthesis protein FlhA [Deferrisomatales bacterium]